MKTLKQAAIGDTVKVVKLHGEGAVKRRIMDMGITRHITKVFLMYTHLKCVQFVRTRLLQVYLTHTAVAES